jgi:hypothetical protein
MPRFSVEVTPETRAVSFPNGTRLEAISAYGSATQFTPAEIGLRSAELPAEIDTSPEFERALRDAGFYEQETIHLEALPQSSLRSGSAEDTLVLRPAIPPGDTDRRVVLYADDSGGLSWHFAENSRLTPEQRQRLEQRGLLRDEGAATFRIAARTTAARESLTEGPPRGALRGPITKIGRKILKVLVIPLAAKVLDRPVETLAGAIESRIRRNRVWRLTADNYAKGPADDFRDWNTFSGKPTLLVVHGIFSSVEGMISKLPRNAMERWMQHYGGRVLGFNHLSVTLSPEENARFFLETVKGALPTDKFRFDILCHSRGGIVSRTLAERGRTLVGDSNCEFRNVHFVASPNKGSALGDPEHVLEMIDVFTNLLTQFPDSHTMFAIETVLGVVKLLAYTAGVALPGMAAMSTGKDGYIASVLNQSRERSLGSYGAATSGYTPRPGLDNGFFTGRFATYVMGRIFADNGRAVANDLVVPKDGVFAGNGHPSFPILDPLVFGDRDAVWHGGFFSEPRTIRHIEEHFGIPGDGPLLDQTVAGSVLPDAPSRPRSYSNGGSKLRGDNGAPAAKPPSAQAETAVERQPSILFHELVEEGVPKPLTVMLSEIARKSPGDPSIDLEFAPGEEQIDLTVELSAPGFAVDNRSKSMTIKRERDPATEEVTFSLTAKHPGAEPVRREIVASFYRGPDCVGAVTHETTVIPKNYSQPAGGSGTSTSDAVFISKRPRTESDLIVFVRKDNAQPNSYEIELKCNVVGEEYGIREMGRLQLEGSDLSNLLTKVIDPTFQTFPNDPNLSDDQFERAVADWSTRFLRKMSELGRTLWDLLPQEFRSEYLRLMESKTSLPPRSISVYSDEMVLPWELIRPSSSSNGQFKAYDPLGVAHIMARWMPSLGARPQPQSFKIRRMILLTPRYGTQPLYWAEKESVELLSIFKNFERPDALDLNYFDGLLDSDSIHLMHFTGHGVWDDSGDLASLRLSDSEVVQAMSLSGRTLGQTAHPILYLNACSIGRNTERLGQPGGFAATCLRNGWSGVIAPYWKVYDPQAMQFGVALYRKLKSGISIGEALQQLRRDQPDNFTAQSYTYFGDPHARLLTDL